MPMSSNLDPAALTGAGLFAGATLLDYPFWLTHLQLRPGMEAYNEQSESWSPFQ